MSTYLFSAHASMGHINPLLSIAHQMKSEGHTVVFALPAAPKMAKYITAQGFRFINIIPSIHVMGFSILPFVSGFRETSLAFKLFFKGLSHYTRAINRILDQLQPDAVISDFTFLAASLSAESKGIPYIIIYHVGLTYKGPGVPPFGSGLPIDGDWGQSGIRYRFMFDSLEYKIEKIIARVRKRFRLPAAEMSYLSCPSSPWLTLVLTAEAIEAPRSSFPSTLFFIGPCILGLRTGKPTHFPFDKISPNKPKIYVSLGTVFNRKPKIFSKIINAFADGSYQLIVSAGGAFSRLRHQHFSSDISLFESLPQVEILSHVDAVISHGGNNTVNETLVAGKPLLVMPVGGEQCDNASRVEYIGAGLRADMHKSNSKEIRGKVDQLLEKPTFSQRTKEISNALALTQGPVSACRFIEHVVLTKQPLPRPKWYPLTVTRDTAPPWKFI